MLTILQGGSTHVHKRRSGEPGAEMPISRLQGYSLGLIVPQRLSNVAPAYPSAGMGHRSTAMILYILPGLGHTESCRRGRLEASAYARGHPPQPHAGQSFTSRHRQKLSVVVPQLWKPRIVPALIGPPHTHNTSHPDVLCARYMPQYQKTEYMYTPSGNPHRSGPRIARHLSISISVVWTPTPPPPNHDPAANYKL